MLARTGRAVTAKPPSEGAMSRTITEQIILMDGPQPTPPDTIPTQWKQTATDKLRVRRTDAPAAMEQQTRTVERLDLRGPRRGAPSAIDRRRTGMRVDTSGLAIRAQRLQLDGVRPGAWRWRARVAELDVHTSREPRSSEEARTRVPPLLDGWSKLQCCRARGLEV